MWILGIVMAGGRGERLYPLTKDRVKAAVPFGWVPLKGKEECHAGDEGRLR